MTLKTSSFFLAVILFAASPAFADKIPAGPREEASLSHHSQLFTHENGSPVRFDFEKTKTAAPFLFTDSHLSANNADSVLFSLGSTDEDSFREHSGKPSLTLKRKDRDDNDNPLFAISLPEPRSQILLLFGLAGVAFLFIRRNPLKEKF